VGGKQTGPSPTDQRKLVSKHYLIVDAQGILFVVILTAENCNGITQLDVSVLAIFRIE
jgi:hypothetical protein